MKEEERMIWLICGATHAGKTVLAQRILEEKHIPYLSLDHLKMGLIRSGLVRITPTSPWQEITDAVWPVAREWIRTCLENGQHLTVEGCYILPNWEKDFTDEQRGQMKGICLALSENYIHTRFCDVLRYANEVEQRLDDDISVGALLRENAFFRENYCDVFVIDENYTAELDALWRKIQ